MHNEENAAINAINSYINLYGKTNLILMGNVRKSHLKVSKHFGIASYDSRPYIGPLHELEKQPRTKWDQGKSLNLVGIQLENIYNGITKLNTEYALYLHPDHRLINVVRPKNYAELESNIPNKYDKNFIKSLSKINANTLSLKGYGHPGMMKCSAFLESYEFFKGNEELFLEIEHLSQNQTAYDDFLLPILFRICNFEVADHHITREVKRRFSFKKLRSPLLHQVRY